jgi:REP element-mobilizing transposase RayT
LPHIYAVGQPLFVTYRLFGSLPAGREFPKKAMSSGEAFVAMDRLLDTAGVGPRHLQMPEIATVVRDSILHGARRDYDLHAWAIMPNHVHLLITPWSEASAFLRRLKGFIARQANLMLKRTGQHESYDHLVRSGEEYRRIARYIVNNPVRAGRVTSIEEFRWSSASGSGDPLQV